MSSTTSPSSSGSSSAVHGSLAIRSGRKGNKKVRTGCITCKLRKVKCDEGKPNCQRCVSTGRRCDGYAPLQRRSLTTVKSPSLVPVFQTSDESRAFDYYCRHSATLLGGLLCDGGIDDFWSGLVVKLAVAEPAVRHALLALSNFHENVTSVNTDNNNKNSLSLTDTRFGFAEYGKAITAVQQWSPGNGSDPGTIPLLVCVLFVCIEFLLEYEQASQLHIMQGRQILSQIDQSQATRASPAVNMLRSALVPMYTRLSLASFLFGNRPAAIPEYLAGDWYIPFDFHSIQDASHQLFHLINTGLQFDRYAHPLIFDPNLTQELYLSLRAEQQRLLSRFKEWSVAFTVFKATLTNPTALQHLLFVFYHAGMIWMSVTLSPSELAFDAHMDHFAGMISHASTAVSISSSFQRQDTTFTFETEIVAPIYWTATKCRHPLLRRAAVRLLSREEVLRRRENLWRSDVSIAIAKKLIEFEEADNDEVFPGEVPRNPHAEVVGEDENLSVPITTAPNLWKAPPSFSDLLLYDSAAERTLPSRHSWANSYVATTIRDLLASDIVATDPARLESPFGIPEWKRVKNALIGKQENGGIWVTLFRDPRPGQVEWDVRKMFWEV